MTFQKGNRGRPAGTPNKLTRRMREVVHEAFEAEGGVDYLRQVAREEQQTFCMLLAKLIPTEVKADVQTNVGLAELMAARARVCRRNGKIEDTN